MSDGFSTDWLSLRAGADTKARSKRLMELAAKVAGSPPEGPRRVVDLGSGTGATLRALAPHLPRPQAWLLVDGDQTLLHEATRLYTIEPMVDVSVATRHTNLSDGGRPWTRTPHLLTASALFDLASAAFIDKVADWCAAERVPLLSMLTYNGDMRAEPAHPLDAQMLSAFNNHQRGTKSFGPAEGPDAVRTLFQAFTNRGFGVEADDSPWVLEAPQDDALIRATIEGWADAASEWLGSKDTVDAWRATRLQNTRTLIVGHTDQLFTPRR